MRSQQAPPKEQNRAATPRDGYFKRLASPEILPQVILCPVGISGAIIAVCTLSEIARQAGEMRHQSIVMRGQLGTMRRQLREMQIAGKQTHEMITHVTKQVGHLEKAATAAKESADAAKLSADVATGVSIPTLRVESFDFWDDGVATPEPLFTPPKVKLAVKNYGKMPAFLRSWSIVFTWDDLPGDPCLRWHTGSGIIVNRVVVEPGMPYTFPVLPSWHVQVFSIEDVKAVLDHRKSFDAYGAVYDSDLFGSPMRRLKFCEAAINISTTGLAGLMRWPRQPTEGAITCRGGQ